ncbi:MAG TPA: transposase [Bacteroidales bacterium]|jgi:hypothetical protein|nr:transposase [Bacteroidales bacterium]MDI9573154.1 transposase [Bacteroidota bacterium]OQC60221.1 MAG: hypothetical protein BWX51_01108 [Bacteroidetes bacterium ADurb.Bin012]HNQ59383.1 transposase [Bacteroidales bacterium]HNU21021.1 transposase [Bacteroidales bacterium]
MFKSNNQQEIFSFEDELNQKQGDLLNSSKGKWFYHILFSNINELDFRDLYSQKASRPNVPGNVLVCALILKELKGISYDELIEGVVFDLHFKTALGLSWIGDIPFSRATLFNF